MRVPRCTVFIIGAYPVNFREALGDNVGRLSVSVYVEQEMGIRLNWKCRAAPRAGERRSRIAVKIPSRNDVSEATSAEISESEPEKSSLRTCLSAGIRREWLLPSVEPEAAGARYATPCIF